MCQLHPDWGHHTWSVLQTIMQSVWPPLAWALSYGPGGMSTVKYI